MNLEQNILQIPIDNIIPNRFQPRLTFEDRGLEELANSIKQHGIIQPLVLRRIGDKYEIIAGERRYKAATLAGLDKVPAIIADIDDNKSAEVAIVENVQRRDLTPIEEARSYKNLLDKGYLTQSELAKKMGISVEKVREVIKISQEPVSLETPIGEEDDSHLGDFLKDESSLSPEEYTENEILKEEIKEVLQTLQPREQEVLELRFGLVDGTCHTLEDVGKRFNVTRERIRQIEAKALRKLRHPSRAKKLKDFLDN